MQTFSKLIAVAAMTAGMSFGSTAFAVPDTTNGNNITNGEFIGLFGPSDDPFPNNLSGLDSQYDSDALYKCDDTSKGSCTDDVPAPGPDYSTAFTIIFTGTNGDGEPSSGTWQYDLGMGLPKAPTFLLLKAGGGRNGGTALYDISMLDLSLAHEWTTADELDDKGISHITFYNGTPPDDNPNEDPVPVPGVLALAGSGLIGLVAVRRRRQST